jgi:predicted DNA-binding transcriptional regulator AlpA
MTHPDQLIVTEAEAAKMLCISQRTLQRLRANGDGPPVIRLTEWRIGYPIAGLKAWTLDRCQPPQTAAVTGGANVA